MIHTIKLGLQTIPGSSIDNAPETIEHNYGEPFQYRFELENENGPVNLRDLTNIKLYIKAVSNDSPLYTLTVSTFTAQSCVQGFIEGTATLPRSLPPARYTYTVWITNSSGTFLVLRPSTFRILPT